MTLKHDIDALQQAALSVEHGLREGGYYNVADCASFDALVRKGNRRGVALLFDEQGNLDEVVDLNGGAKHVEVTSEGANVHVAHSFPGWNNAGPRSEKHREDTQRVLKQTEVESYEPVSGSKRSTTDAARMNAELRKRQEMNSAKERAIRAEGIARSERIAQQMKEISNKQWNHGRIA